MSPANAWAKHWQLDPAVSFLNHGSFGACPTGVLAYQQRIRDRLESEPIRFLVRELEPLLDSVRAELAQFIGAPADDVVFVSNATTGVNSVLRSLVLQPGDELLVTDHEYNASRNALDFAASHSGARVVMARIPFPVAGPSEVLEHLFRHLTPRTRLILVDHISSPTGMVFPVDEIIREARRRGVDTLIDGAHAGGMVELNLETLSPTYYAGNCHKWICAPKGSGFLYVHPERQDLIRPLAISHGATSARTDRSRFQIEFGWTGTHDPSACLAIGEALRVMGTLLPGGWTELRASNHQKALRGRRMLCDALGVEPPCPAEMIGAMATVALPNGRQIPDAPLYIDELQEALWENERIEVPVVYWRTFPNRWVRVSAQLYNSDEQYEQLAKALLTYHAHRL